MKNTLKKVLAIFGTRPEAIKMAPVLGELGKRVDINHVVCITAQHRQMLDQVLEIFDITPNYDLNLMTKNQSLTQMFSSMLVKVKEIIDIEHPDWVIVQGDTTTTVTSSLAAYFSKTKVAHIEAGLRTYNKWAPFPEEINRKIVTTIADINFTPTESAKRNLLCEGIKEESIITTGNTIIDSLQKIITIPKTERIKNLLNNFPCSDDGKLILVTAHRRENFGVPMKNICTAIAKLATNYPQHRIIFPVHMNPKVQESVKKMLSRIDNIKLIGTLNYVSMVHLINSAYLILTDSGGIQEEAPSFGIPVLVMRKLTGASRGSESWGCQTCRD